MSNRAQRERQVQFRASLATGFPRCEAADLLQRCGAPDCAAIFAPTERQRVRLAQGKRLFCGGHLHSNESSPRHYQTKHRLVPQPRRCDGCGKTFIASPRGLLMAQRTRVRTPAAPAAGSRFSGLRAEPLNRLLCDHCCVKASNELILACCVCGMQSCDEKLFMNCGRRCGGQHVELRRKRAKQLIDHQIDPKVWREIVARSTDKPDPVLFRRMSVSERLGWMAKSTAPPYNSQGRD